MAVTHPESEKNTRFLDVNRDVLERIHESYQEMMLHDGYGEMRVEVRILKRGQKEVIVHFGKQYRFVVDAS